MGLVAIWKRLRYYERSFGARQTAMLYGARATGRPLIELRVPGMPHAIACRPTEPDRFTICHVFVEHDCDLAIPLNPQFIVDAGANVGYVSAYYANRFPEADIVGLEPDVGNIAVARRNCAPYPSVELLWAGLWPRDVPLQIVDPNAKSWEFRSGSGGRSDRRRRGHLDSDTPAAEQP